MATTARPWEVLVVGIKDSTGTAVASGKVRWYNPGTLVAAVAYSDAACATPITAPLTLNSQGQGTIYFLEPVRVIVKDSTEATSYYDDIAALNRHDSVYVTSASINGGAETTLETVLSTATTALGAGFQYKESSGATARNYVDVIGGAWVSVKDFGAVGDGTTDDTVAIQAASDRIKARGGGWVLFEKGTYKITAAITVDTAGVSWRGVARGVSIIKNFGTTTNAVTINLGSSVDSKIVIRDLSITANTTSSGVGIQVTNGNRIKVENVSVALHRSGIVASAVSEPQILNCTIESTDDNAAAIGVNVGTRGRVDNCNVISATTNGTGITLAGDARAIDSYVEKFATAVSLATAGAQARGVLSSLATTAFSLGAASTIVEACFASGAATGFSVGAVASCSVALCRASSCTTDLSVNTAATLFDERANSFAGTLTFNAATPAALPLRLRAATLTTVSSSAATITPDISLGQNVNIFHWTAAPTNVTVAAHATATLAVGDILVLVLSNNGAGTATYGWNAQYKNPDASTNLTETTQITGTVRTYLFRWNGSNFVKLMRGPDTAF